jgi:hypothetical protein
VSRVTAPAAVAKLTTQLRQGDVITLAGLGGFSVIGVRPYGEQSIIRLAWDNLAVICDRDITWQPVTPGGISYLHGYTPCTRCRGSGITWH